MPKKRRKSRAKPGALPKGAYRLPDGNIMLPPGKPTVLKNGRSISIRAVLRDPPDYDRLARVLLDIARDQATKPQPSDDELVA